MSAMSNLGISQEYMCESTYVQEQSQEVVQIVGSMIVGKYNNNLIGQEFTWAEFRAKFPSPKQIFFSNQFRVDQAVVFGPSRRKLINIILSDKYANWLFE